MNQARHPRYPLRFRIAYDDGNSFMTADVSDISESGAFLETVMPLKLGAKVTLTPLVDDELGIHEFSGEVVRVIEEDADQIDRVAGMGIQFLEPDATALENLRKMFARHAQSAK